MKNRYRVVKENVGYVAQIKKWYWPFWQELYWFNWNPSVNKAYALIEKYQKENS